MKILVTGATGYIGAHYVKVAADHGHEVIATDFNFKQNNIEKYSSQIIDWDFPNPLNENVPSIKLCILEQWDRFLYQ